MLGLFRGFLDLLLGQGLGVSAGLPDRDPILEHPVVLISPVRGLLWDVITGKHVECMQAHLTCVAGVLLQSAMAP